MYSCNLDLFQFILFFPFHYTLQDIDWDPFDGQFLVSVSSDQTTRLHAPWRQDGLLVSSSHCVVFVN